MNADSRMSPALVIDAGDDVAVALADMHAGATVPLNGRELRLAEEIPAKHKFALHSIAAGTPVRMYGVTVGIATRNIPPGGRITTENLAHRAEGYSVRSVERPWTPPDVAHLRQRSFLGYRRADGQVGTRNYWLVFALVFCENRNLQNLREAFEEGLQPVAGEPYREQMRELRHLYEQGKIDAIRSYQPTLQQPRTSSGTIFPNVDGIRFLVHDAGCGGTRQDAQTLCGLLAGYLHNPNVAGATVLSLGCQNAQTAMLQEEIARRDAQFSKPLLIFDHQQSALQEPMLGRALRETFLALIEANRCERQPAPLSALRVGLKCGGSDGFSGITANPALGYVADMLAALGGTCILSEFPELCGVEQELIDRCTNLEDAARFAALMRAYSERAAAVDADFSMNPSPGNIRDGLITDAMKSAGAVRKGGSSPVRAVLDYPEYATRPGLNLLCTPGNDVESVTAQVGAGANLVLFTTGLGTPTGNPIAPVVKVASNSALATRMPDIIDFDCGGILSQGQSIAQCGADLLDFLVEVASGTRKTAAELHQQNDFIPWKRGISL